MGGKLSLTLCGGYGSREPLVIEKIIEGAKKAFR